MISGIIFWTMQVFGILGVLAHFYFEPLDPILLKISIVFFLTPLITYLVVNLIDYLTKPNKEDYD